MINAARNLTVGFVFLGSLAVLGVATLKINALPFLNKAEALSVRFPNVDQLETGDDVVVHGYRVGQVEKIHYDPAASASAPIVVEVSVPRDVRSRMGAGTTFKIHSAGPLGGRFLEITPPEGEKPVEPATNFVGSAPGDLFKQLEMLVQENGKVTSLLANMDAAVVEVKEAFRAANSGEGMLSLFLNDKDTRDKAAKFISDASETVAKLREDVTGDKGILAYLLRDEKGKEELRSMVQKLSEGLASEKGILAYLMNDEKARDELRSIIEKVNQIVTDVKEGPGIASRLINDKELANKLEGTLDDFHDVVHKVNTGQGTLGQIVNNPKAWDELVRILVLARETIEDIREQAPVSTFVNAIFAAF